MIGALRLILEHIWPMLAAGFGLGLLVGAATCVARSSRVVSPLSFLLWAILVAAGATALVAGWLPGRYGLWLDIGLLLLVTYLAGCLGGCALRSVLRRPDSPTSVPTGT